MNLSTFMNTSLIMLIHMGLLILICDSMKPILNERACLFRCHIQVHHKSTSYWLAATHMAHTIHSKYIMILQPSLLLPLSKCRTPPWRKHSPNLYLNPWHSPLKNVDVTIVELISAVTAANSSLLLVHYCNSNYHSILFLSKQFSFSKYLNPVYAQ